MHCNVKTRCEALKALAQKKLGTDDPAVVEITRGGKNRSHHVLRRLNAQLDELRTENEALRQALAELKPRPAAPQSAPAPEAEASEPQA